MHAEIIPEQTLLSRDASSPKVLPMAKVSYPSVCGPEGDWFSAPHSCSFPHLWKMVQVGWPVRGGLQACPQALPEGSQGPCYHPGCADDLASGHERPAPRLCFQADLLFCHHLWPPELPTGQ